MKNRLSVVVMTVLVIMAILVWAVAKNQRNTIKSAAAAVPLVSGEITPTPRVQVLILPAAPQAASRTPSQEVPRAVTGGESKHIAQPGETVTSMAADLLGKDSKANRDAIVNANSSLKADPDKLVAGKAYRIPAAGDVPAAEVAPTVPAAVSPPAQEESKVAVQPEPVKVLKYTAAPGDTVTTLAGAFLGSDDKTHQDAIINANSSLRADPDHVVAGQAYRIPAPDGLSASATPSAAQSAPRPTTQPDADQVILAGSTRALRYTARPGDTVTNLAIALLGDDTQANRDAIINCNPSLKRDPDRVVAGQTYWIPAPTTPVRNP